MSWRQLSSESGPIHYQVHGSGPSLVLLHGATMDHRLWATQIPALSPSFQLIVPDLPAHGRSRPSVGFSLRCCSDAVVRILDAEGIESAGFIGQSMGGYVAQVFAHEHPARISCFLAVDTSPLQASYYSAVDRALLAITPALLKLYPYGVLVQSIARGITVTAAARQSALAALTVLSRTEMAGIMRSVYRGILEYAERDLRMRVPTLIVYGEQDRSGKVIGYCQRWSATEGHPIRTIPNAAHNANADNPDAFNATALEFFADQALPPPGT